MNKLLIGLVALICVGCVPVAQNPPPPAIATTVVKVTELPPTIQPLPVSHASIREVPLYTVEIYPGSLKENIERICAHYGWRQVVWDVPQDYRWVGKAQISGENLIAVLRKLLNDYPLQAVFYEGNHVIYIHPRTLR